ncbi:hypothetical protein ILUMI_16164, partial [Ignelater luminosus]
ENIQMGQKERGTGEGKSRSKPKPTKKIKWAPRMEAHIRTNMAMKQVMSSKEVISKDKNDWCMIGTWNVRGWNGKKEELLAEFVK